MLKRYLARVAVLVLIGLTGAAQTALGQTQTTPASGAIVIDMASGAVLLEKNADIPVPRWHVAGYG